MVFHAFDPSLRVRWREILSWYPVELVRRLDASMAIIHKRLWITGATRGPDCCWDPGGIIHHIVDSVSDGHSCMMKLVIECRHRIISPTEFFKTLETTWIDRRLGIFHELTWHVRCTCFCRIISLL